MLRRRQSLAAGTAAVLASSRSTTGRHLPAGMPRCLGRGTKGGATFLTVWRAPPAAGCVRGSAATPTTMTLTPRIWATTTTTPTAVPKSSVIAGLAGSGCSALLRKQRPQRHMVQHQQVRQYTKSSGSALSKVTDRARAAYERFNQRKTEMVVLYGSTFFVVHELLGIASYAIAYGLLASGVIDIEHVAGHLGITEEDAQKRGFSLHDRMVTFGMTIAMVKALDVMGLVPLRWAINFLITPRIARYVGPYADKLFRKALNRFTSKRKK